MSPPRLDAFWSAHVSTLFRELAFAERPAAAAAAGFARLESWWPATGEVAAWAAAVRDHDLALACLNADGGDLERGEPGFLTDPARRVEAVEGVGRAIGLAERLGGRTINVLAGRVAPGVPRRRQWDAAVAALRECATLAEHRGATLVIEPINDRDVPGYLVPTPREATALLDAVGSEAVRLLYDAHHATMMGLDPVRDAPAYVDRIGHVQYAAPGRRDPDPGDDTAWRLADALHDRGYDGAIGLEYVPRGDTAASLDFVRTRSAA